MRPTSWCRKEGPQKIWVAYGVERSGWALAGGMGAGCALGRVGYLGRSGNLNHGDDAWWPMEWERKGPI